MRRYRLFSKPVEGDYPFFVLLECIMYDGEDLSLGKDEHDAGQLLRWLNERGCLYHIEVNRWNRPDHMEDGYTSHFHRFISYREMEMISYHRDDYDLMIYDDETATLMSLFHPQYEEIIPPEVLAARAAEAERIEKEAALIAELREKEDAENARRIAKGKEPIVSVMVPRPLNADQDVVAPPTRAWLQKVGRSISKVVFGRDHERP